jgi:peptidoglycan lytic transglycosylase G
MRFRWYEYSIYPITFIGLALALAIIGIGVVGATIIISIVTSMAHPFRSIKNLVIFLTIVALIGATVFWHFYTSEVKIANQSISVTVTKDMSFGSLTDSLTQLGVIENPAFFKACSRIRGIDKRLWVGRYDFSGMASVRSVLNTLGAGEVAMISVTIPEGLRVEQTAGILANILNLDSSVIVAQAFDTSSCEDRYSLPNLEGYLFPETYRFPVGVSLLEVLDKMVSDARRAVESDLDGAELSDDGLNPSEIVILASVIEAEARIVDEQKLISGVYHNRLRKGMLMQADPTVRYGLRVFTRKLYFKDLDKDTPYNTYMYKGLPPGPINSPGLSAIQAAVHPMASSYLYFVADGSGGHVFSETLKEHKKEIHRIKSERKKLK